MGKVLASWRCGFLQVGILIFDDVEELDFVGPWEVLASVNQVKPGSLGLKLVGTHSPVRAVNGMRVLPDILLEDCSQLDLLIIPGGSGRQKQMVEQPTLDFVRQQYEGLTYLASVCTGTFILLKAGLLDGKLATTHHSALEELASYPEVEVVEERLTQSGNILCAAGVTSGMDLAFFLVRQLFGKSMAEQVARRIEYPQPLDDIAPRVGGGSSY